MTSISIVSAVAARIQLHLLENSKQYSDNWGNEVQKLPSVLEKINKLLKDADQEIRQKKEIFDLEKEIVQLLYDIDDALAGNGNVVQSRSRRKMPLMAAPDRSSNTDVGSLRTRLEATVQKLGSKIQAAAASNKTEKTLDKANPGETNLHLAAIPAAPSSGDEDPAQIDENKLKDALLNDNLRVVSLWGDSGIGKSTLAEKAFDHAQVREHFDVFAWVPINDGFQTKKVLQDILLQLLPDRKLETWAMDEIELTLEIFKVLKDKKCLVVLEDLQDTGDWRSIRIAFPIDNDSDSQTKSKSKTRSESKILITTPSKELADEAAINADGVLELKPLTEAQCLEILQEKADFDADESQTVGKIIFRLSGGSPLIAIILGRALKTPPEAAARNQLLQQLNSYLSRNQSPRETTQVLRLSYDRLPHELKPCLLHMGQFPKAKDIEADKLYLLLAAEGLILPEDSKRSGKTLSMESLRKMLKNLALKRLIEVQEDKVSTTRMYKSCRLHDKIRSFCVSKGEDEDFFEIVDFKDQKKVNISTRRLAVYLGKYEDGDVIQFRSQDTVKKIRSLLIFDTFDPKEKSWPEEINDLKEFGHLRVLDFDGVDFNVRKPPKGMDKLVLLRYLSFRECFLETLPSAISKFPCLESLDLRVKAECKMTIPNVLSNLNRLMYLYFPVVYKSDGNGKLQLQGLKMLEILVNFDTGVCDVADLSCFHNLQILTTISKGKRKELDGIINYLDEKTDINLQQSSLDIKNFDCYSKSRTDIFRKLLACKSIHSLHIEGQIGCSLKNVEISRNFTKMVFDGSELEDGPMDVLGKLEDLRSLTLCNDAFVGTEMTISAASKFPELRILKLLNLQYLQKVTFEKGTMLKLSTLVIDKCEDLKEVVMSKALDNRLRLAQGKKGDDIYFVVPPPAIINYDNKSGNPASAP